MRVPLLTLASALVLFVGGCDGATDAESPERRILLTGSSTIAPLATEIAARFEQANPNVRIDVETGGSSRGIRDARSGAADVGMSSRTLRGEEEEGLAQIRLAFDGVAFVVHADNPIGELSDEDLLAIYTGERMRWSDVGGEDAPIVVVSRAEGRSELDLVAEYLDIEPSAIRADVVDGETQQNLKTVIGNVNAITYTSVGAAEFAILEGSPLKILPLAGVEATSASIRSGEFPLARPLILLRPDADGDGVADPDPTVDAYIEFATGPDVSDLAIGLGYVPLAADATETP